MTLEDMNPNKFYNILRNLNDMESIFAQRYQKEEYYNSSETYWKFLDDYFITSNKLSNLYFPADNIESLSFQTDMRKQISNLSEIQQIRSGLDINIGKQFNFPCKFPHSGSCYEFIYIFEGNAEVQLEKKKFQLKAGDFFFHAPGDLYALNSVPGSIVININLRKRYIHEVYPRLFSGCPVAVRFLDNYFQNGTDGNYMLFHTGNQQEFKDAVLRMFIEYMWGDKYRNEVIRTNFEMLIAYLKRYIKGDIETEQILTTVEKNWNQILDYLIWNYQYATLEKTVEAVHFSKQYIARIVQQVTGGTFSKLVKEIRVGKVKEYLTETTLSLENIAELTGFSSTSYLWRSFKELTGVSPSEYREAKESDR